MKPNESDWERAALICREVAELPDRTSSDLNPDEMIVTGDELAPMIADALAAERDKTLRNLTGALEKWCPDANTAIRAKVAADNEALEDFLRVLNSSVDKIIGMFRPASGDFLSFKKDEVICGPNDRAIMGFDTHFPEKWLKEDFGFTQAEAEWFISRVNALREEH